MLKFHKKNKLLRVILYVSVLSSLYLIISILVNRKNIYPTTAEKKELSLFFNNKKIKTANDIIYIQNLIIDKVKHEFVSSNELNSIHTLKIRKGICYDRSLILQKYCLLNGYSIRPVYLFWGTDNTSILDFFKSNVSSHNVFEININDKWYLVRTNHKCKKLESLETYLQSGKTVPTHTRYIRYLNNRNGNFIYPSYLPDIYFF